MSEVVDLLVGQVGAFNALLFLGLFGSDVLRARWEKHRFDRLDNRVGRLEAAFIETDGGEVDDER